jgi:hypothetical protein
VSTRLTSQSRVTGTSLYRAVDKRGRTVDFLLRPDRGIAAAQAFLSQGPRRCRSVLCELHFNRLSAATVATCGVPGFFVPRVPPPFPAPEALSVYDTSPLTLVRRDRLLRCRLARKPLDECG